MTFQQFVGDPVFRQRYWARNHIGWRHMDAARPNAGHRAVAALERSGTVVASSPRTSTCCTRRREAVE